MGDVAEQAKQDGPRQEAVFLRYTQEELDRNFDQRASAVNADAVVARRKALSGAARRRGNYLSNVSYGPGKDECLDIFPATAGAPTLIFVHGGAWRNFTKEDFSFLGAEFAAAGAHGVILNFSKLPNVSLTVVADQVRRAVAWVYRQAGSFGGRPHNIYLCGQSSGSHLAAAALTTNWAALGLPSDMIRGGICVSGIYDLEPVVLSARKAYVKLDAAQVHELSPIRNLDRLRCPVLVAYADGDTPEFRRQSEAFITALSGHKRLSQSLCLSNTNHFEIVESLTEPANPLAQAVLKEMGLFPVAVRDGALLL